MNTTENKAYVASCGLYCGSCRRYTKGKCPGCAENHKATWCTVRLCTQEKGYQTCAECTEFQDVNDCKKFNNFFSKVFAFIFRSDRKASLQRIAEIGVAAYALEMEEKKMHVLPRK